MPRCSATCGTCSQRLRLNPTKTRRLAHRSTTMRSQVSSSGSRPPRCSAPMRSATSSATRCATSAQTSAPPPPPSSGGLLARKQIEGASCRQLAAEPTLQREWQSKQRARTQASAPPPPPPSGGLLAQKQIGGASCRQSGFRAESRPTRYKTRGTCRASRAHTLRPPPQLSSGSMLAYTCEFLPHSANDATLSLPPKNARSARMCANSWLLLHSTMSLCSRGTTGNMWLACPCTFGCARAPLRALPSKKPACLATDARQAMR